MSSDNNDRKALKEIHHYLEIGRYEKAKELLRRQLAEHPDQEELLYLTAFCQYWLDEYDEAAEACREALKNGASPEKCNALLGKIYFEQQDYFNAEGCFLEALRINPQNAEVLANYGFLMLKTGHREKAAELIEEALRLEPNNEEVLHYAFYYYLARDKREDQMETLKELLETSGSEVRSLINIGMAELFRKNYKSARECFRQAFLLDPANKGLLSMLENLDKTTHPLYLPQRIVSKLGGPWPVWFIFIGAIFALRSFGFYTAMAITAGVYLLLCVSTWITPFIYRILVKRG
jgi:tetratricopeptide (TPR) repeat protein